MTSPTFSRRVPAIVLGLSVAGLAAAACGIPGTQASTASATSGPLRCELILDEARGATTIQGRVTTDRAVSGTYRLSIASRGAGGSSTINQSGDFAASPGVPAILGETTLGGPRANFRADLELSVSGQRLTCTEASGPREI